MENQNQKGGNQFRRGNLTCLFIWDEVFFCPWINTGGTFFLILLHFILSPSSTLQMFGQDSTHLTAFSFAAIRAKFHGSAFGYKNVLALCTCQIFAEKCTRLQPCILVQFWLKSVQGYSLVYLSNYWLKSVQIWLQKCTCLVYLLNFC